MRDGDIIFRKIRNFLRLKAVPETKREMILRSLQNTLWTENINKPVNGESQLKRVFVKVVDGSWGVLQNWTDHRFYGQTV